MTSISPKASPPNVGIPDWRDERAYPSDPLDTADQRHVRMIGAGGIDAEMLRLALWRWEFLRRLDEYRGDWQKQHQIVVESEKYRLAHCFPDPSNPRPYPLWFEDMLGYVWDMAPIARVLFDLSAPLEPQLRFTKRFLESGVAHLKRHGQLKGSRSTFLRLPPQSKWLSFLRALDAREQEAKFWEIGQVLAGKDDKTAAATAGIRLHGAAKRLQESLITIRRDTRTPFTFKPNA